MNQFVSRLNKISRSHDRSMQKNLRDHIVFHCSRAFFEEFIDCWLRWFLSESFRMKFEKHRVRLTSMTTIYGIFPLTRSDTSFFLLYAFFGVCLSPQVFRCSDTSFGSRGTYSRSSYYTFAWGSP